MRAHSRSLAAAVSLALAAPAFAGAPPPSVACAVKPAAGASDRGDPRFRTAAQRGLNFMAIGARAWTQQNPTCYGCHVHSTTLEGLTIGRHNGYDVSPKDMDLMMKAMLNQSQGVHTTTFTTAR